MSDDLISRKDAIDAVTAYLDLCCMTEARFHEGGKSYNRQIAEEIFEEIFTDESKQGEWIPCSEELPNENGDYLVTLENGVVKTLGYSTTQRTTYPKGFYHIKDGFSWRQVQNPVIAWMPLPEPWEGADDEL